MAELLVKAVDATHPDPAKDARGSWKRGDVVCAFEDGHEWGRLEILPPEKGGKFVIVRLPGVTLAQLHAETGKRFAANLLAPETDDKGETVGRRAVNVDLDQLAPTDKEKADKEGTLTLSKEAVAFLATEKPKKEKSNAINDLGR